jgi:sugar phosphate isomerase/epimerase
MSTRRSFIKQAALVGAGVLLKPTISFGEFQSTDFNQIGIQLYTLRDVLSKDVRGTIAKVAGAGYNHVETFYGYSGQNAAVNFWGLNSKEFRTLLAENNLKTYSGHYQLNDFLTPGKGNDDALKAQIDIAKAVGQEYLVVPVPSKMVIENGGVDDYKFVASQLNKAGELCRKSNLKFGYHNHAWEFKPLENTTGYDILQTETEPEFVKFEIDLFWTVNSGNDPLSLFKKYPGRFEMWHVKDMDKTDRNKFTEVGTGSIDFSKIFEQADTAGLKYFFVEQDKIYSKDPFESIKESCKNIKQMQFKR